MLKGELIVVVPNGYYPESAKARGRPAAHLIRAGENKTLCGRDANCWSIGSYDPVYVSCLICQRSYSKKGWG